MATTLGKLILELGIDDSKIASQLRDAKANALKAASGVEKDIKKLKIQDAISTSPEIDNSEFSPKLQKLEEDISKISDRIEAKLNSLNVSNVNKQLHLVPSVDHEPLEELNAHLDRKLKHVLTLNQEFSLNPLKVHVDNRDLDNLSSKLDAIRNRSEKLEVVTEDIGDIDLSALERDLEQAVFKGINDGVEGYYRDPIRPTAVKQVEKAATTNDIESVMAHLAQQSEELALSNQNLALAMRGLDSSVQANSAAANDMPVKMSKIIHTSSKETLMDKIMGFPARAFETVVFGAFEGTGAQLAYDFVKGAQRYVEGKTGVDAETVGYNFGRYGYNRTKGLAMVGAEMFGYKGGLKEVGDDIAYLGRKLDEFIDPRKLVAKMKGFEDLLVGMLEDTEVYNDPKAAKQRFNDYIEPTWEGVREGGMRAAGVGLRAAATPFRIRKRVQLAQSMEIAKKYAEIINVPEIENPDDVQTIALTTGGVSLEEGAPNTYFANNLLKNVLGPGVATVPVPNVYSNNANELGGLFELRKQLVLDIVTNLQNNPEFAKQFGLDKEGGLSVEDLNNPMQFDKLLHIAIEAGYNPDAIAMEATRLAYEQKYPGKKYIFAGTSAGTVAAEEATAIAERGGAENVKGFGATLGLTGLTQTASNKNFRAFVGDLDPLFAAMFGKEGFESLSQDQIKTLWEKMNEAEDLPFPSEIMRGMNEMLAGLLRSSKNTKVILGTGGGHNLATFLSEPKFQEALLNYLGDYIQGIPELAQGIDRGDPAKTNPASPLANLYSKLYGSKAGVLTGVGGEHFQDLQRTFAALKGDESALRQIESGKYSFFDPNTGTARQSGDVQPDILYVPDEMENGLTRQLKKIFKSLDNVPDFVKEDIENFKKAFRLLAEAVPESDKALLKINKSKGRELLRTIGAITGDPKALEEIESGEYSFYNPQSGKASQGGDKPDILYAVDEVINSLNFDIESLDEQTIKDLEDYKAVLVSFSEALSSTETIDPERLKDIANSLKTFLTDDFVKSRSKGLDQEKIAEAEVAFRKAFGQSPDIPDSVAMHPEQLEGYRMLSKNMGTTVHGNEDIPMLDAKAIGAGAAGAIFTDRHREKAWKTSKVPFYDTWRQFLGVANTVGKEADIQRTLPPDLAGEVYESGTHYSVQELLPGMDVGKLVQQAKEKGDSQEILKYIAHMGKLLRQLHDNKVTHGDFHFGNVFSVDTEEGETLKAIDFGYSKKGASRRDIREDYKKALVKIKGKKEMGVQMPGVIEKMELPVEVADALEAFRRGYRGEDIDPLTRPALPPREGKPPTMGKPPITTISSLPSDLKIKQRAALRRKIELERKAAETAIKTPELVYDMPESVMKPGESLEGAKSSLVSTEEAAATGSEMALSFVKGVGTGLTNVAESAGKAMATATENKLVSLVNRLMRRVPGDPTSIDANAPTIESLSDIGPEQIAKASALGIEDAATALGNVAKGSIAAARALVQVSKAAGVVITGAQPAATEFIESSRQRMQAIRFSVNAISTSLTSSPNPSQLPPEVTRQLQYLMGSTEEGNKKEGYIDRFISDLDAAINLLEPQARTKPLEGNQLTNLKSQGVKAKKTLAQIQAEIEEQYNRLLELVNELQQNNSDVIDAQVVNVTPEAFTMPGQDQVQQLTAANPPPDTKKLLQRVSEDFVDLARIARKGKTIAPRGAGQEELDRIAALNEEEKKIAAKQIKETADEAYRSVESIQSSLGQNTPKQASATKGQITRALNIANQIDTTDIGNAVGDGIVEGMSDRLSLLKSESERYVEEGVKNPIKSGLDIQSPSKLTEYFGRMTGEGFVKGISSTLGSVGQVIKDLYSMADMYQENLGKAFDSKVITDELAILRDSITEALTAIGQLEYASSAIQNATTAAGRIINYPNEAIVAKYKEDVRSNAKRIATEPPDPDTHPAAHNIPADAKKVIFVSSGFTGTKGRISNEIASKLEPMAPKGTHMIPFENKNFDVSGTLDEAGIARVVMDAIIMPMKAVKQGVNEEALRLAKQAYAVKQERPDVEIGFVGHSAGGFIVREAQEILRAMEIFSQALSMGTPLLGAFLAIKPNTVSLMGEKDQLRVFTGQKEAIVPGVSGHFSPHYLDESNEMREILTKYLHDGITPELISRIHELGSAIQGLEPGNSGPVMRFDRLRQGERSQRNLPADDSKLIGQNIGKGLAIGIDNGAKEALEATNHMADAVIDITESTFEISSPSRWATRIGEFIGQGLANGLEGAKSKVTGAINGIKDSAKKSFDDWINSPTEDDFVPIEWNTKRPEADIPIIGGAYAFVLDSMESMKNIATALPEIGRGLAGVFEGVMQNTPAIMNMAKGFLVFDFIIKPLISSLLAFEGVAFQTAVEMQNMTNVIKLVSSSAAEGAKNIAFVRSQVQALGGDIRASMEGFSQLGASAQGTRLEGEGTRQIFSAVSQAALVYQMDPEAQGRAYTALSQMMDKSVVSAEELRGQLAESLPGAIAVAARAMGVSTQELGKMMEMGEVMAEDLLPRFAQQLSAETAGGLAGSARSAQSSINKLNNEILLLQEASGKTTIPIRVMGMDAASAGLKVVRENILALSVALTALIVTLLKNSAIELIKFLGKFAKIEAFMKLIEKAAANLFKSLIPMIKQLGMAFLKQFLLLTAIGDVFTIFKKGFGDASGGMMDTAKSTTDAWQSYLNVLEEAKKKQEDLEKTKPQGFNFERFRESGGVDSIKSFAQNAGPLGYLTDVGKAIKGEDSSSAAGYVGRLTTSVLGFKQIIDISKDAKNFFTAFVDGIGLRDELKNLMKDESLIESTLVGSIVGKEVSRIVENGFRSYVRFGTDGDTWLDYDPVTLVLGGLKNVGFDLGTSYGDIQRQQRDIAVGEQITSGGNIQQEARTTMFDLEGNAINDLAKVVDLDEQYRQAQQRRAALPREAIEEQRKAEEEINRILEERGLAYQAVGKQQANLQLAVENYKAQIKAVQEELATLGYSEKDNERRKQLEGQLAVLKANMNDSQLLLDNINHKIGEAANKVELLARQFRLVNAELQNANFALEMKTAQQQALVAAIPAGQEGLRQGTSNVIQQQQIAEKIGINTNFIQQTQGILNDQEYIQILESAGLKATSTAADIATKIEELADGSLKTNLTKIQEAKEQLQQTELESAQLGAQMAELKQQLDEQFFQMGLELENMMIEIGQQVELLEAEFKAAANDRKIQSAARGIGRSMKLLRTDHFSGFMGLLEEFVNVLGEQLRTTADFLRQKIELTQNLFNQLRQNDMFNLGIPQVDGSITGGQGSGSGATMGSGTLVGITGNSGRGSGAHLDIRKREGDRRLTDEELNRFQVNGRPLTSYQITSEYGPRRAPVPGASTMHNGIDFGIGVGGRITTTVPIRSVNIREPSETGGGGYVTDVVFEDGLEVSLLHLDPSTLTAGIGSGGRATGVSRNLPSFLEQFEGFHSTPYWDQQQYSWGFGTKAPGASGSISREQATTEMMNYLSGVEETIAEMVNVPLNQNQFDALASLIYNIGPGNFQNSTVRRELNQGNYEAAANAFGMWNRGNNGVLPGLVNRRRAEAELFRSGRSIGGRSSFAAPATQQSQYERFMREGYALTERRDYQSALINFRRALQERPNDRYATEAINNVTGYINRNRPTNTSGMSAREGSQTRPPNLPSAMTGGSSTATQQPASVQNYAASINAQSQGLLQRSGQYINDVITLHNQQIAEINRLQQFANQQFNLDLDNIVSRAQQDAVVEKREVEDAQRLLQDQNEDRAFLATPEYARTPEMIAQQDTREATRAARDEGIAIDRQIEDLRFDMSEVERRLPETVSILRGLGAPEEFVRQMEQAGQSVIASSREKIAVLEQQRGNVDTFLTDTVNRIAAETQRALENTQFQNASDIANLNADLMEEQATRADQTNNPQEAARLRAAAEEVRTIRANEELIRDLEQRKEADPINAAQYDEQIETAQQKIAVSLENLNETLRRTSEEIAQYNFIASRESSREVRALEIQQLRFNGDPMQALIMEQEDELNAQLDGFAKRRLEIAADLQLDEPTRKQLEADLAEIEAMTIEMTAQLNLRAKVELEIANENPLLDARSTNLQALIPNLNANYEQGRARDMQAELDGLMIEQRLRETLHSIEDPSNNLTEETRERLRLLAEETAELEKQNLERNHALQIRRDQIEIERNNITNFGGPQALAQVQDEYLGMFGITPTWQMRQERLPMQLEMQNLNYQQQLIDLEELRNSGKLTQEAFEKAKLSLEAMNNIKLDQLRIEASGIPEIVNAVKSPLQGFFKEMLDPNSTKTFGEAFSDMINGMLANLAQLAAEWVTNSLFSSFLGGGAGSPGKEGGLFSTLFGGGSEEGTTDPLAAIAAESDPATALAMGGQEASMNLTIGAQEAANILIQAGIQFAQSVQSSAMSVSMGANGGYNWGGLAGVIRPTGWLEGMTAFSTPSVRSGGGLPGFDMNNLNFSFARGAQTIGQSIIQSSSQGANTFGGGIASALQDATRNVSSIFSGGIFGSLLQMGLSFLTGGFNTGGVVTSDRAITIPNFAKGGKLGGVADAAIAEAFKRERPYGKPRLIMANEGEWVLNRKQQAIAKSMGVDERILNFAGGGIVGSRPTPTVNTSNIGGASSNVSVPITINSSGGSEEEDAKLAKKLKDPIEGLVRSIIQRESRFNGSMYR